MSSLGDTAAAEQRARGERKAKTALDRRMPLGVKLDGDTATVVADTETMTDGFDWLLEHFAEKFPQVSGQRWEVLDDTVDIGSWEMGFVDRDTGEPGAKTLYRYRAKIRRVADGVLDYADHIAEHVTRARRRKAVDTTATDSGRWLVVGLSDCQIGKGDYGGTPVLLDRLAGTWDRLAEHVKTRDYAGVALVELGDIVEGTSCFYDGQAHTVDLNMTDQCKVAIDVLVQAVDTVAGTVPRVLFGAVPSNHGELRVGKQTVATDRARDNFDLILADVVSRIVAAAPDQYPGVEVWTPPTQGGDPFVLTLDLDGVMVGFTHGHQIMAKGAARISKIEHWWLHHRFSDSTRPDAERWATAADCDVMCVGHGHTLQISQALGKLAVQFPALESGSEYFTTGSGKRSSAGLLAVDVHPALPFKADRFTLL